MCNFPLAKEINQQGSSAILKKINLSLDLSELCANRVLDLNTNEVRISDYEVPTLEWLDKRLEDVNTEIDSVEKHLQHLKGYKSWCKSLKSIHKKQKQFESKRRK